jgi:hypothetical protein
MKSSHNITLVTGLFDIGRGDLKSGFSRSFDHYKECFSKLLKLKQYNMVIFCEKELEPFIWQFRDATNTRIIHKSINDLKKFPFFEQVQNIRKKPEWINRAGWIRDSTQATLELYNPVVMSKQFFLNDAAILNYFGTDYFYWIDAGLANTVQLDSYFNSENFSDKLLFDTNGMLYICFPYDGKVEVHGFEKTQLNKYAEEDTQWVARGGFFGGRKDIIHEINDIYYGLLHSTLNAGLMGTEESIFTIITYKYKHLCDIKMIDNNGLVYKAFENIKKINYIKPKHPIAFYVLTYNLPKQFKMWVDSMISAYPNEFKSAKKYVINNSDDQDVDAEYKELFKKHDFEEHKFNNIGINRGRLFAAEHFDKSDHEYMVFFEDDMLMYAPSSARLCKSGFATYQNSLFDKAIQIIKLNKLDWLKLNFTEFYGINSENWAWYNVPKDVKEKHFKKREDGMDSKKTVIDYMGVQKGLPYAVGEFHYCNWPLVFTKEGNRKMFLDTKFANPYEQTWMSFAFSLMRDKKVRVGCLLASPINHNRVFHYEKGKRKEN